LQNESCLLITSSSGIVSDVPSAVILINRPAFIRGAVRSVNVWCALSPRRITGPIFFHETVNSDRYVNDILNPFFNQLTAEEKQYVYFQQDNATAHTANAAMAAIREGFEDRIISRGLWPPRSPNPSFCYFYLWGNLKGKVYKNNPRSTEAPQNDITRAIGSVTVDELQKVTQNLLGDVRHVCEQKRVTFNSCYKTWKVCVIFLQYSVMNVCIQRLMRGSQWHDCEVSRWTAAALSHAASFLLDWTHCRTRTQSTRKSVCVWTPRRSHVTLIVYRQSEWSCEVCLLLDTFGTRGYVLLNLN
jgi:hypothetical protein